MPSGPMYRVNLPASTDADFIETFKATDPDTGSLIDFSGGEVTFVVKDHGTTKITATKANGKITLPATGYFKITISESEMDNLSQGYYDVGCIAVVSGIKRQIFVGKMAVVDGFIE